DITPPVLKSIEISPKSVTVGQTVNIKAEISDDLSGVESVQLHFKSSEQLGGYGIRLQQNQDGIWEGNLQLMQYSDTIGTWSVDSIFIIDKANNEISYDNNNFPDLDKHKFTVENVENDVLPPAAPEVNLVTENSTSV